MAEGMPYQLYAHVERVSFLMNAKWTDSRNKCTAELIKSGLQVTINFNMNCKDFFKHIQKKTKFLKKTKTSKQILNIL